MFTVILKCIIYEHLLMKMVFFYHKKKRSGKKLTHTVVMCIAVLQVMVCTNGSGSGFGVGQKQSWPIFGFPVGQKVKGVIWFFTILPI